MAFLVIKLGALGDFVQALGAFSAIRSHHCEAKIVLLTTEPYKELAEASGFFDEVWTGGRPATTNIAAWVTLRQRLISGGFSRVYDLQTSDRSSFYRSLFWPGPVPEWSGTAQNSSHPHNNPQRNTLHTIERQAEQLMAAGITVVPSPNLAALNLADPSAFFRFGLVKNYVLFAPLGAASRPRKRWPPSQFSALARILSKKDITPVFLGTRSEKATIDEITAECPSARNLAGETSILDLVSLGLGATAAVGNDTGPMHIAATAGCPSVVLFSRDSDPALCGQWGLSVTILRRDEIVNITVAEVVDALAL
jgi:ADP-heptose:LPS heptosyltransferase